MSQNRSSAVMQQRFEPTDSLDDFPTPPWATRALFDQLIGRHGWLDPSDQSVREPAANRGHMVRPLTEIFRRVEASDIHDYGAGFPVRDYLAGPVPERTDWTVTNPPFRLAEKFVARALECSDVVAVLVRSAFLESVGRYNTLFRVRPPKMVLQFTERVVMHRGLLSPNGSTATAYCWIVWVRPYLGPTELAWIPPCRKRLERADDYEGWS
ncbi:methyltransferase [Tabrizicola flagellatus]|uniref:methyltransferase n=1 Tax=Tabrizicola flagellatus TaxID=2593021 RepID=UPI0011F24C93|nr:methyltransferase [Tabrizicola flagellatus]